MSGADDDPEKSADADSTSEEDSTAESDATPDDRPAPLSDLAKQLDDGSTPPETDSESAPSDTGDVARNSPMETPADTGRFGPDAPDTDGFDAQDSGEFDADTAEEAPLGNIAEEVQRRRERRERESEAESDLFEEMDVREVDSDELWDVIFGEEEREEAEGRAVGAGGEAEQIGTAPGADDRPEHRIPKAKYCQRCPYLSAPPMVACDHDGTDIVEVSDSEHFVVRGCPFADQQDPNLRTFE